MDFWKAIFHQKISRGCTKAQDLEREVEKKIILRDRENKILLKILLFQDLVFPRSESSNLQDFQMIRKAGLTNLHLSPEK